MSTIIFENMPFCDFCDARYHDGVVATGLTIVLKENRLQKTEELRTLSAAAVTRLRNDILSCALPPGQKLRLDALRTQLGVGFSPLREALVHLASEGLVEAEEQRGFRVAPVSADDLADVTQTRIAIEALALRDAVPNGDDKWEASIVTTFHLLSRVDPIDSATHGASEEWSKRHRDFHFSLVSACKSRLLKRFWTQAYDRAERYRRLAVTYDSKPRDNLKEHEKLMKVALERDVEKTCKLCAEHIMKTHQIIMFDIGKKLTIFGG